MLVMQFGQFLDHDLTLTPEMNLCSEHCPSEMEIDCCEFLHDLETPKSCLPIEIPHNDPFYNAHYPKPVCLDFKRSQPFPCNNNNNNNYSAGNPDSSREQFNLLTAFVDGSHIYGSEPEKNRELREFVGGRLKVLLAEEEEEEGLLPLEKNQCDDGEEESSLADDDDNDDAKKTKKTKKKKRKSFVAGDIRVNENPGLQSLHTLWVREHNRLARIIEAANNDDGNSSSSLSDETIFQEARRWVVAEWQNIVYSEFLPIVLGSQLMNEYGLTIEGWTKTHHLPPSGSSSSSSSTSSSDDDQSGGGGGGGGGMMMHDLKRSLYDENLSPNIFNSFATAAFRFGHSLIAGKVQMMKDDRSTESFNLRESFFNTSILFAGKMDLLLRGMCNQKSELLNNIISDEVRNFLFQNPNETFGSDLVARNIQRGRDHELGSYNDYRRACGLRSLPGTFFSQAPPELSSRLWRKLSRVYPHPEDIELFPGGISEEPVEGGIVGPTFACILAEQFRRLKEGDRYFFTHANVDRRVRFCPSDLRLIGRRTMRDVFCDNSNMKSIPLNPFQHPKNGEDLDAAAADCAVKGNKLEPTQVCIDGMYTYIYIYIYIPGAAQLVRIFTKMHVASKLRKIGKI